jgi:hypothetical protein
MIDLADFSAPIIDLADFSAPNIDLADFSVHNSRATSNHDF